MSATGSTFMSMMGWRFKLQWYLKQLFPLTYRTRYWTYHPETDRNEEHFVVWRMWFGRCFDREDVWVKS